MVTCETWTLVKILDSDTGGILDLDFGKGLDSDTGDVLDSDSGKCLDSDTGELLYSDSGYIWICPGKPLISYFLSFAGTGFCFSFYFL